MAVRLPLLAGAANVLMRGATDLLSVVGGGPKGVKGPCPNCDIELSTVSPLQYLQHVKGQCLRPAIPVTTDDNSSMTELQYISDRAADPSTPTDGSRRLHAG